MQHKHFDQLSPLFILGIARSGTTLLQSLLDGHPQLLVDVADSHFFEWYRYTYRWIYGWSRRSVSLEEKLAMAEGIFREMEIDFWLARTRKLLVRLNG